VKRFAIEQNKKNTVLLSVVFGEEVLPSLEELVVFVKGVPRVTKRQPVSGLQGSIRIDGEASIPIAIHDLQSFREWARSDEYPQRGEFCWLGNIFWADLSMEEAYTHGSVKTECSSVIHRICKAKDLGKVFVDAMRVSSPKANLSCEPDVMFVAHETFETGAIREIEGSKPGSVIEFEGAPDLVVEIVSDSSTEKDVELLPDSLFAAGVKEYWLIDAREEKILFEIHRRGPTSFVKAPVRSGKVRSRVLGHAFRLDRTIDRGGRPTYDLSYC